MSKTTDFIDFIENAKAEGMNVSVRIFKGFYQVFAQGKDFQREITCGGVIEQSGTQLRARFDKKTGELILPKSQQTSNEPKVIASFEI